MGPSSLGWAVLLQRGVTAEAEVSLLRPWDGSWEQCSHFQLLLLPWREQMSICVHLWRCCPALGRGSLEEVAQGGLLGGRRGGWGWHNPFLQAVAPQRLLPSLAVVIRAHWPGRGRAQRGWSQDKALSGWAHSDPTGQGGKIPREVLFSAAA